MSGTNSRIKVRGVKMKVEINTTDKCLHIIPENITEDLALESIVERSGGLAKHIVLECYVPHGSSEGNDNG